MWSSLHFRDFPENEGAQDRMHNECMTAVRLTFHQLSDARVNWMLAGGVTAQPHRKARQETQESETRPKRLGFKREGWS